MTKNQWIASGGGAATLIGGAATIIAALITSGVMLLEDSDGGGTQNNCSTGADCAGRDHNEAGQGQPTEPPASSPSSPSAASAEAAAPTTYSLVYEHKPLGLSLPGCSGSWYADFEERTSKFYSDDDIRDMKAQAANNGQQVPLDFYYTNCAWGTFGSANPWGIVSSEPTGPEDCADSAQSAGMDSISLAPSENQGQVEPGTLICTVTDAGVALLQVKSFGPDAGSGAMHSPERVVLDVTLWKKS
ncbi:hypothetical protein [Streptomyces sp. NWU339]|uniref:hypothetical protein n=1 Tax=Streptomyces sp. NWU339 TaxID=2185284 RepID=UPI0011B42577|nr:hypothetical protein [Streptomyces sp. NWU339]